MSSRPPKLGAEESKFLTRVMTLGSATSLPVVMGASELLGLVGIVYADTGHLNELEEVHPGAARRIVPPLDYYALTDNWFSSVPLQDEFEHIELMRLGRLQIPDFSTYLGCLCELHKRRRKYAKILSAQPLPKMVQVSPRALVEFGCIDTAALASWLTWRKFFYDLDNRSAQETGYLFEPVLAAAIGGEPKGARSRVVTRTGDASKGRQVDCWKVRPDGKPLAYEFKLRVTIAASGQGRFSEELAFAEDCSNSGAIPVLVVLDPTSNPRLRELQAAFEARGGHAFVGAAAWAHLEDEAGSTMAAFIERYVRKPILEVSKFEATCARVEVPGAQALLDFEARILHGELILRFGTHETRILRLEDEALSTEDSQIAEPE